MSMNNAAYMQSHSCKVGAIKKKIAKDLFTAYYAKQTYHHACGIYYKHDKKLFSALPINNWTEP